MTKSEKAILAFESGCNCSQAIAGAFSENMGLNLSDALKMSAAFGGGMADGEVCGAVTGSLMCIGMIHGVGEPMTAEQKKTFRLKVTTFNDMFKSMNKSIICRELLGCDTSLVEGAAFFKENKLSEKICKGLIIDAVEILEKEYIK